MLNPYNITNYLMTQNELEEFILAAMTVAGKTAKIIFPKIDRFLYEYSYYKTEQTPFEIIQDMIKKNVLNKELKRVKLGKYKLLNKGYQELIQANLNLRKCSTQDLEKISGIGMKTSRFFILHTRQNQEIAVLDTHILKYLSDKLGYANIPKVTPTNEQKYLKIEKIFVEEAKKRNQNIADFDLEIWNLYSLK